MKNATKTKKTAKNQAAKFSRFNQPVACRMCGKKTTFSEANGNVGLDLCKKCFDAASEENERLDAGLPTKNASKKTAAAEAPLGNAKGITVLGKKVAAYFAPTAEDWKETGDANRATVKKTAAAAKKAKTAAKRAKTVAAKKPAKKTAAKKTAKAAAKTGEKKTGKGATVLALIARKTGASAEELMHATGWQAHSVRGFLSTANSKGLAKISSERNEDGARIYFGK